MMSDLDRLRRRLWIAIACAPLGSAACDDASAPASAPSPPDAKAEASAPEASAPEASLPAEPSADSPPPSADPPPEDWGKASEPPPVPTPPPPPPPDPTLSQSLPMTPEELCKDSFGTIVSRAVAKKERESGSATSHGCPDQIAPTHSPARSLLADVTETIRKVDPEACCYRSLVRKGRPYVDAGVMHRPGFRIGARRDATEPDVDPGIARLDPAVRRRVAAGWLSDAREEASAVAAFERAALELIDVGAPSALVSACREAADDERRHAWICLDIASRYAGRKLALTGGPRPRARARDPWRVLWDAFIGGAVAETAAALVAARCAARSSAPLRDALARIADDETRHAELAWTTLAWGLPRLSAADRARFFSLARGHRASDRESPPTRAHRPETEPEAGHGRMSREERAAAVAEVWERIAIPMLGWLERSLARDAPHVGSRSDTLGPFAGRRGASGFG